MKTSRGLVGLLLLAGCSTLPTRNIGDLGAATDGQLVSVQGVLRVSGFDGATYFHLCPADIGDDFARCLDLVVPDREISRHLKGDLRCASVSGRFIAFDDDTVGMGYLLSKIGMIEDAAVGRCD
jgi:hypothetical protein